MAAWDDGDSDSGGGVGNGGGGGSRSIPVTGVYGTVRVSDL